LKEGQRDQRVVEDAAKGEAGGLLAELGQPLQRAGRWLDEKLDHALVAVLDRRAVHGDDVAEGEIVLGVLRLDQKEVRDDRPPETLPRLQVLFSATTLANCATKSCT
jgi:hypothetical protein